jgi:hypothetical protein
VTRGYGSAILIAGAGNALGVVVALGLPRRSPASADGRTPRAGSPRPADDVAEG